MLFDEAVDLMFEKLGTHKIMAQAASVNDEVTVRNVSCIIYDKRIFFKTDKEFRKTKQLLANPNTALCFSGVQIEGVASNLGLVAHEQNRKFAQLYQEYWATSYNAYPHTESEILIEITPRFVEIWDQHEDNRGYQVLLDYETKTVEVKQYDK